MARLRDDIPAWVGRYVGLDFKEGGRSREEGVDCWGLVRLVYAERLGIYLPGLDGEYRGVDDSEAIGRIVAHQRDFSRRWRPIPVDERAVGDVALLRVLGGAHVGVLVSRTRMLHAQLGTASCVERLDSRFWAPRLEGAFRFQGPVLVRGTTRVLGGRTIAAERPEGETVAEMLAGAGIAPGPSLRVYLGDREVPPEAWMRVRPRAGRMLSIAAAAPRGAGGNKTALRIVLTIAVVALGAWAGAGVAGAALGEAAVGSLGYSLLQGTVTAAIGLAGTLAINALIPPPKPRISEGAGAVTSRSITGARNEVRPYAPIPVILGEHRTVPVYAALPYTEIVGDDQYLRLLFLIGHGPLALTDHRIGDTPIDQFEGVEIEVRDGYPDDDPIRIYPGAVVEDQLQVLLEQVNGWSLRTSALNANELSVDVTWPQGLAEFTAGGSRQQRTCSVEVEYSPAGLNAWRQVNAASPDFSRGMDFLFRLGNVRTSSPLGPSDGRGNHVGRIAWGGAWPDAKPSYLPDQSYAWEVSGYIRFPDPGEYELAIDGSDSIELSLGNRLLVSWYGEHTPDGAFGAHTGTKTIAFGSPLSDPRGARGWKAFTLRMESRSPNGGSIALGWKKPGDGAFSVIPAENIMTAGGTLGESRYRWFDVSQYSSSITLTEARTDAIRRSLSWAVEPGQYDVRVRRSTLDTASDRILDKVYWTALRTITNEEPVRMPGLCRVALRIKATDQLSGVIDNYNVLAKSVLPDWDAESGAWITRPTSNPASCYRAVLQGPGNARPLADSRLLESDLQEWHVANAAMGVECNMVLDTQGTVFQRCADVAATGRATPGMRDGRHTIVRDRRQSVPAQHFTPRNSRGFRGRKAFPDLPHALRMTFLNAEKGYERDERLVADDGYAIDGKDAFGVDRPDLPEAEIFETLELLGVTKADQAWRHGRYMIAVARLRPEVYELTADFEALACERGDLVLVSHDVPMWGAGAGRIVRQVLDTDGNLVGLELDDSVTMDVGTQYCVRFRLADGTSLLRPIVTAEGISTTITLSQPIGAGDPRPAAGDLWMFGPIGLETRELIVKAIDIDRDLAARITLVDHSPAVHEADQGEIPPFDPGITYPAAYQNRPETPVIVTIRSDDYVMLRGADGTLRPRMVITLRQVSGTRPRAILALVLTRPKLPDGSVGSGPYTYHPLVPIEANAVSVEGVEEGVTYQIRLRTVTASGLASDWVEAEHTIVGKSAPPPDVTTFTVSRLSDGTRRYAWTIADPPPDLSGVRIRYGLTWMTWGQMTAVSAETLPTSPVELNEPPEGTWRFGIKAIDTSGNESVNAVYTTVSLGPPRLEGIAFSRDEGSLGWTGTKTDCHIAGRALEADDLATWDTLATPYSAATWDAWPRWNMAPRSPIVYETGTLDAGFLFGFSPDVSAAGEGTLLVEVATSTNGADWSGWSEVSIARETIVNARYLRARVTCSAAAGVPIPVISRVLLMMRAETLIHEHQDLDTADLGSAWRLGVGDVRLPIPAGRFAVIRSVLLGFNNSGAGFTWDLVDRDTTIGPRVRIYDADNRPADAVIDAVIRGL